MKNLNVEECRAFLKSKGYFVQNLWSTGDIEHTAEELGHEVTDEQVIEIWDLMGRRHDASIGVNWDMIETVIEEYFSS